MRAWMARFFYCERCGACHRRCKAFGVLAASRFSNRKQRYARTIRAFRAKNGNLRERSDGSPDGFSVWYVERAIFPVCTYFFMYNH